MADWPADGANPWTADLKAYIDAGDAITGSGTGLGYCEESGGVYPGRPAGTAPCMFIGYDDPTVVTSPGTTAGGGGFVDGKDFWVPVPA